MKTISVICLLCMFAGGIAAQDYPKAEVYGGYSYVNIDTNGLSSRQSANGWEASVSGSFNKWFAVEADVAGYYRTEAVPVGGGCCAVSVSDYAYGAGPRFNIRPLFLHALIGGDHLTGSSESQDSLAGAFGGGVEWPVSRRLAVRASVDYAFTRHNILGGSSYTQNNIRAGVGLVYTFGGRKSLAPPVPASAPPRVSRHEAPSRSGMPIPALGLVATTRENGGAEISEVAPGSIAALAGLRAGDVINAVDGDAIKSAMELQVALSNRAPGTKVRLAFMVRGYWQSQTTVVLK